MKTKLKIIIPAAIAVIAVIIAIIFIRLPEAGTVDIGSLMSTAQKYLVEMDYEQAIAEFEKIIELEPNNVDAYLGLAQAYRDSGDADKAIEVLEKGYELTGDERLRDMIKELTGEAAAEETETVVTTVSETETTTEITTTEEILLMPDFVGMTTGEAVSACSSMGIKYTIQTVENSYVEPGIVMGQSVMANSKLDDNTSVLITVSQKERQKTTVTTTTAPVITTTAPVTTTVTETTKDKTEKTQWRMNYFYYPSFEGMGSDNEYTFVYDDNGRIVKCLVRGIHIEGDEEYVIYTDSIEVSYSDDMKTIYCNGYTEYSEEERYEYKYKYLFDGKMLKRIIEDEDFIEEDYVMENGMYVGNEFFVEHAYFDSVFNPYEMGYKSLYSNEEYYDFKQTDLNYDANGNIINEIWEYTTIGWLANSYGVLENKMTYDEQNNLLTYKQTDKHCYNVDGEEHEENNSVCLKYGYEQFDSTKIPGDTQFLNGLIINMLVGIIGY